MSKKAQKKEKSAMTVSLYGNLFFVIIELLMAIYTSSQAVLLDAVYDAVEFIMLLPSIFLIPLLYKPSTEKHPFGYLQIESMFVVVKGVTMTAVTVGLIINNIEIMLHGGRSVSFSTVAYFELLAAILGVLVSVYLKNKNKVVNSPLVSMEMRGWQIDSIVSMGMTLAFFLPVVITAKWFAPVIPYLDQIITVVLSLFMIPAPIKAVVTGLRDLFLIPPEEETVDEIKETVEPILYNYGYKKLYYDIVRTGRKLWISVYITFERDEISISRFKVVQNDCIQALAQKYPDFYFELLPDIEFNKER
ncbi:cation diffusion facilitator family transporter [Emergencia sp.]|uniref:cation diffusion facilitator family transporter n=1 Tax=Emergencia sp. TaxID=1926557 RepID=UPI003AF00E36